MTGILLLFISLILAVIVIAPTFKEPRVFKWIILGYLLRVLLMFVDYYHLCPIPGSGGDSEDFNEIALANQKSSDNYFVTNYELFLTYLYAVTDCSRLFAQYVNVLFGTFYLVVLSKLLKYLKTSYEYRIMIVRMAVLMPNLIIFSAILLREAWIELFVILSIYYFVKWFNSKGFFNIIISFMFVIGATLMHNGCIAIIPGMMISVLLYNTKKNEINLSKLSFVSLSVLTVLFLNCKICAF